jgi:NADH-quinone oxidoreductase subunit J
VIAFALLAIALVASAIFTITARKAVHSVVGLLANFVVIAALYLSLSAEFLAFIQILVYSGAILILFVFVIALLSSGTGPFNVGPDRLPAMRVPAIVLSIVALGLVEWSFVRDSADIAAISASHSAGFEPGAADALGSITNFGAALFTTYLFPFEITAFILMVAVIGVVLLAGDAPPVKPMPHHKRRARIREPIVKVGR